MRVKSHPHLYCHTCILQLKKKNVHFFSIFFGVRRINALAAGDSMPMVSAGDRAPDYLCMDDVDEDIVTLDEDDRGALNSALIEPE